MGKRTNIGNVCLFIENKDYFLSVYVDDINMVAEKQEMAHHVEEIDEAG